MTDRPRRVVLADDTPDMLLLLDSVFETAGYEVVAAAADGTEAVELWRDACRRTTVDVVVLDQQMPGLTGLEVAQVILTEQPDARIVLFSAYLDDEVEASARALGVAACVNKDDVFSLPDHPAIAG